MEKKANSNKSLSTIKRAFLKIEELQARVQELEQGEQEPIAVVGMACRFPGSAHDPDAYWQLLYNGVDAISEIPADRWDVDAYYDPDPSAIGKMYTKWGAFLSDVDKFDPQFFGISPREAVALDPKQRLVLEVAWEALEHGGIAPDKLSGTKTGVFIGACTMDYMQMQVKNDNPQRYGMYFAAGNADSMLSGRLSYILGLQGPSVTIDTACSSSLVTIHLACQSLRMGESRMCLAGGVNNLLSPDSAITFSKASMLATDGRCKTFDAAANGYVQGEGCGIVVLKRLSDALANRDQILALIPGSAVNQDGPSSGLTAPNGPAQEAVIREALANADLQSRQVSYVEAHGTGTSLGDPIEVQALGAVYGENRSADEPLLIGSVKTNFGHLEGAAGVAGVIKVILALQHREIPRHLHFRKPNPFIPWDELPVKVADTRMTWPVDEGERFAGVSSFGFSGTNAHVIVGEAPKTTTQKQVNGRDQHLFVLSAKGDAALQASAQKYVDFLAGNHKLDVADVCYTASAGRAHFTNRLAIAASDTAELGARLQSYLQDPTAEGIARGEVLEPDPPKLAFLFTGQGAQYFRMGRSLYDTQPVFRHVLDECDQLLQPLLPTSLLDVLYGEDSTLIDKTEFTQPALFAVEYALAELWRSWGVTPAVVMGHSLGEYVAACVAGVFSLTDALKLVATRGKLMQQLPQHGTMASVFAPEAKVAEVIRPLSSKIAIAAINGPSNVVISGAEEGIATTLEKLAQQGIKHKKLTVSHAFHSPLIEPMLTEFERAVHSIELRQPNLRLVSNVTGKTEPGEHFQDPAYWLRHVREPVRFADSVETLCQAGYRIFLEIGPHPTLVPMAMQNVTNKACVWLPTLRRKRDDWQQLLQTLASLYVAGADIDWRGFSDEESSRRVTLPTYPFQRQRYWVDETPSAPASNGLFTARKSPAGPVHPLLGNRLFAPILQETLFESRLSLQTHPFLNDHRVHGAVVVPLTAFIEMANAAAREIPGQGNYYIKNMDILEACLLGDDETRTMQVVLKSNSGDGSEFEIISFAAEQSSDGEDSWTRHVTGQLVREDPAIERPGRHPLDSKRIQQDGQLISPQTYYALAEEHGMHLGDSFRGLTEIWRGEGEAIGKIVLPATLQGETENYIWHPALLDTCLQFFAAMMMTGEEIMPDNVFMPIHVEMFRISATPGGELWSYATLQERQNGSDDTVVVDFRVFDASQALVAELRGMRCKRVDRETLQRAGARELQNWLYEVKWTSKPLAGAAARHAEYPDYLPATRALHSHLAKQFRRLTSKSDLARHDACLTLLDELCIHYVVKAFDDLQFSWPAAPVRSLEEVAVELGVATHHRRLLSRLLEMLAEENLCKQVDGGWHFPSKPDLPGVEQTLAGLAAASVSESAEFGFVNRAGEQLAAALKGDVDPLEVLFPGGSFDAAEEVYEKSAPARVFNGLASEALAEIVRSLPADRTLRVLEIGAGTGGTTASLLPALPADRTKYVFTDLSALFLSRAQARFRQYPFVEYRELDIEKTPETQGFTGEKFDVIAATNVLHATRDLTVTLQHVRELLAPNGVLLVVEGMRKERWIDLSFGLTDGWWRFTDTELRPGYPLLSADKWEALMRRLDFTEVTHVTHKSDSQRAAASNAILLGRAAQPSSPTMQEAWLLLGAQDPVSTGLQETLMKNGHAVIRVTRSKRFRKTNESTFAINPENPVHFKRLLESVVSEGGLKCAGVLNLWPLDAAAQKLSLAELDVAVRRESESAIHLLQALVASEVCQSTPVWMVTSLAQAVEGDASTLQVQNAPLWGLARTMATEHPELKCIRIDLDGSAHAASVAHLYQEIMAGDGEDQIAYRNGMRYAARLDRAKFSSQPVRGTSQSPMVRLEITEPGVIDGLTLRSASNPAPGPNEVELRVHATGLNFRDVLNVLGMRDDADPLGGECAGLVTRVGKSVDKFKIGDRVLAITSGALGTYVNATVELVRRLPQEIGFQEAATLPVCFLTAHYSLHHVGRIARGERVLIHAAAGGVGLAAVQIALQAGVEIFATAGSDSKRAYLASIGVRHVMNSRTLDFADEVMKITNKEGVDIVLNSLAGEFVPRSLALLRTDGRFLEIGKKDILTDKEAAAINPKGHYHAIDLAGKISSAPASISPFLDHIMKQISDGSLKPLPLQAFPLEQAADAFRHLAHARHTGKVVVTQSDTGLPSRRNGNGEVVSVHASGTYLITGGLSGLGFLMAEWLVGQGATSLVLTGRRGPDESVQGKIAALTENGVNVVVEQTDASEPAAMARLFEGIQKDLSPLRGIIHSAGVLDDGALVQQSWPRFATVMAPKVLGSWILHQLTEDLTLDFFVMFSSMTGLLGAAGQSNHAAACAFQDALAHHRQRLGLPATTINWGPWTEIGAGVRHDVMTKAGKVGISGIRPDQGLLLFDLILRNYRPQVGVFAVDWNSYSAQFPETPHFFSDLVQTAVEREPKAVTGSERLLIDDLKIATPKKRKKLLFEFVEKSAMRVLEMDSSQAINEKQPLTDLGLDSLMAVELRNLLSSGLGTGQSLPATLVFDYPTIAAIANYLDRDLPIRENGSKETPQKSGAEGDILDNIQQLSDEEVEKLFAERTKREP